jgi:uncharacterized membrane protein
VRRLLIPLVLLAGFALAMAQNVPGVAEPPQGVPPVVWGLLGLVLPWLYATFLSKLPGWLRFVASWGISFAVVAIIGFVFLHYNLTQFLAAIGSLVIIMQAVYQMMTKPAAKLKAENDSTKAREAAHN